MLAFVKQFFNVCFCCLLKTITLQACFDFYSDFNKEIDMGRECNLLPHSKLEKSLLDKISYFPSFFQFGLLSDKGQWGKIFFLLKDNFIVNSTDVKASLKKEIVHTFILAFMAPFLNNLYCILLFFPCFELHKQIIMSQMISEA